MNEQRKSCFAVLATLASRSPRRLVVAWPVATAVGKRDVASELNAARPSTFALWQAWKQCVGNRASSMLVFGTIALLDGHKVSESCVVTPLLPRLPTAMLVKCFGAKHGQTSLNAESWMAFHCNFQRLAQCC